MCYLSGETYLRTARMCPLPSNQSLRAHWLGANNRIRLLLDEVSERQIYLELSKQRFRCKACQQTFVAETPIVKKYCFIIEKVRWSIVTRLKKNTAMTEIANQKNVSVPSVYHIIKISINQQILFENSCQRFSVLTGLNPCRMA